MPFESILPQSIGKTGVILDTFWPLNRRKINYYLSLKCLPKGGAILTKTDDEFWGTCLPGRYFPSVFNTILRFKGEKERLI